MGGFHVHSDAISNLHRHFNAALLACSRQPAVLQAGMTPNQSNWLFDTPLGQG